MIKYILVAIIFFCNSVIFAAPNHQINVVLDWFINPDHAPLMVAEQEGFFKEQGLDVKFIAPTDPSEGEKMVAAGKADIAISYQPTLMYKIDHGLPLVRFATLIDHPLNCLTVLKSSSIKTPKDLKGKRIGYSTSGIEATMLKMMLKKYNLELKDIELINVKFDLVQGLLTNKIDGFSGGMRNFEPLALAEAGKPAQTFFPENYGMPLYDELILVTNKNNLSNPDLKKFVAALQKGVDFLLKNPELSWQKFATIHPELNNELNKKSWFATLPYFAKNSGKLDTPRYVKFTAFMYKEGLIEKNYQTGYYATTLTLQ